MILTSLSFLNIIFFVCIIQIFEFFSCQLVHLSGQDKLQIPIVLSRRNILNDIIHHNSTNCNTNFSADSRNSFSLAAKKPLHLGVTAFRYKPFTSVFWFIGRFIRQNYYKVTIGFDVCNIAAVLKNPLYVRAEILRLKKLKFLRNFQTIWQKICRRICTTIFMRCCLDYLRKKY